MLKKCDVIKGHFQDDVILIPKCKKSLRCSISNAVAGKIVLIFASKNAEEFEKYSSIKRLL